MSTTVRVLVDATLTSGEELALPAAAAHHVRSVLRLSRDTDVVLFDGRGNVHSARLTLVARDGVRALVGEALVSNSESPLHVTLVQSISRGERMDYTLQKAVELGVQRIVPVISSRTVVRLDRRREDKRREHWHGVIQHAAEQSGRALLPVLEAVRALADWQPPDASTSYVLQPHAPQPLARQSPPMAAVNLVAGPEGGFDAREVAALERLGVTPVSLGPRILRTETAALAALAVMQGLWGDFA